MSSTTPALITIVRAGAGAGKTRGLVHQVQNHFHHFMKEKKRAPRVIVTTFTRKATQELRERLLLKATQEKDWGFVEYLQSSDLFVTTIHGVLNSFLKKVSHLTGQDPSFQIIGDQESQRLSRRILQKMVKEGQVSTEWLARYDFNKSLELAMAYADTRAFRWPAITEEKYLQEIKNYNANLLSNLKGAMIEIAFESEVFNQYQKELLQFIEGWPKDSNLWKNYFESRPKKPRVSKNTGTDGEAVKDVQNQLEKLEKFLEEECFDQKSISAVVSDLQEFEQWSKLFLEKFRQEKLENSVLSMHDLEALSAEILNNQPELCQYFSSDWDYWLIDEFQDTSPVQMEILAKLTDQKPVYLVGDPRQSIYLFRGAKAEIFQKEWASDDRQKVELNTNYRSRPSLIHLASDIFKSPMVPARETGEQVPIKVILYPKDPSKNEVKSESAEDNELTSKYEARAVVRELIDKKMNGAAWSKLAVLGRTHQQLYSLSLELKKHSIPYVLSGGQTFWDRREIRDVVQFLRFLINPHDNLNLMSLLREPWLIDDSKQMLPHELMTKWIHEAKELSYWIYFQKQNHPVIKILKDFNERAQNENLISLAEEFAAERGLLDSIIALDSTGQKECQVWKLLTWLRQQERLPGWQILKALQQLDESLMGDPGSAREVEAVQLMTIHASKGLEFDHVYLLDISKAPKLSTRKDFSAEEEQGFWSFPVWNEEKEKHVSTRFCRLHYEGLKGKERAEFKRLFYVAVTRAKESLTLLTSDNIKPDSWFSMLNLPQNLEEGLIDKKNYQFHIQKFNPDLPEITYSSKPHKAEQVRAPWRVEHEPEYKKAMSVTKLIENPYAVDASAEGLLKKHRGVQIHKLFEVLKYHSFEGAENWIQNQSASAAASKADLKKSLSFIKNLKEIPIQKILEQGHAEWSFQVLIDDQWIEGQIDLWAEVDGVIWILDYKTGNKTNAESAWKQLNWYGQALKKLGFQGAQKHVVLYPLEESVLIRES